MSLVTRRGLVRRAVACALLLGVMASARAERDRGPTRERPTAGGRLAWVVDGDLDLLGDMWVDLPFPVARRQAAFVAVDSRTTLAQPRKLTFDVRNLQYAFALGWRGPFGKSKGARVSVFAGQRGKQAVDADGQAFVQYVALGIETEDYRASRAFPDCAGNRCSPTARFEGRVAVGGVIEQREVEADAVLRGDTRVWLWNLGRDRAGLGLDFEVDALADASSLEADWVVGPRVSFPVAGGRRASFFVHYDSGGNPLGNGDPLWSLGFEYEQGRNAPPPGIEAPDVSGRVALGRGEGRTAGQLLLRVSSPEFARAVRAVAEVDGQILTADDTGDLFYLYFVGLEQGRNGWVPGVFFYHRSNHQLAEPNDTVTSINVLEVGAETERWRGPARRREGGWPGSIDGFLRAGYLVHSEFGENVRWHARGGARWSLPLGRSGPIPYVRVEVEEGDVERRLYAAGVHGPRGVDFRVEYRRDEQYFSADRTVWLGAMAYAF